MECLREDPMPGPITQDIKESRAFTFQVIKKYSSVRQGTSTMIRTFIINHNCKDSFISCYLEKRIPVCVYSYA